MNNDEKVINALKAGARTSEEVIDATGIYGSTVSIILTKLTDEGIVTRRPDEFKEGRPGPRPYIYTLAPTQP